MTHLEMSWREFVERVGGRRRPGEGGVTGEVYPIFCDTRASFEAGYAAGAGFALQAIRDVAQRVNPKRCTYPGCTIIDPPNGSHAHPGWES